MRKRRIVLALVGAAAVALPLTVWSAGSQAATAGASPMPSMSSSMPSMPSMPSSGDPTPPDNPGTQTTTVRYGPWHLGAGSQSNPYDAFLQLPKFGLKPPCQNCDITSLQQNLVYADGTVADMDTGPMLHHYVLFRGGKDVTCPLPTGTQRIWASGNERTPADLPPGYGFEVGANETWDMVTDFMNYSSQPKDVYVTITATWVPGHTLKTAIPAWFDITGACGISAYPVPAGPSQQSWTWTSTMTGKIIQINGHMHGGGKHISVTNVTTGQMVCDSIATPGTMLGYGEIMHMTQCVGDPVAIVHKGDKLRLTAYYDPTTPRLAVMGIDTLFIAPDDSV